MCFSQNVKFLRYGTLRYTVSLASSHTHGHVQIGSERVWLLAARLLSRPGHSTPDTYIDVYWKAHFPTIPSLHGCTAFDTYFVPFRCRCKTGTNPVP